MKAPDKIYVLSDLTPHYAFKSFNDSEVEYIRKEALLEWLEHAKTIYNIRGANTFELLTLQMITEYINEM